MNYGKQDITEGDVEEVSKVIQSPFLTTGPKVPEFEDAFASYVGSKYAIAVSSGTAALHIACLAAELRSGDELITTPLTFVASANCGLYCGARPVFADVKNDLTGLIDPSDIERKITSKTRIIIPVHYAGQPCDSANIHAIAKKKGLSVIEDASHALGAEYEGQKIGSCKYCDMTVFSFHPVKHITTGEGGMVTTNSEVLYKKLLKLRNHGITRNEAEYENTAHGPWYYEMQEIGFNYRVTDFQCALGISQLRRIESFVNERRHIAAKYTLILKDIPGISLMKEDKNRKHSYHIYIILVENSQKRLILYNYMKEKGISCQVHYLPVYQHPCYQKLGYISGLCPNAEKLYDRILSIPIYYGLTEGQQNYVISCLRNFFLFEQSLSLFF